jgi:hypothetical protein
MDAPPPKSVAAKEGASGSWMDAPPPKIEEPRGAFDLSARGLLKGTAEALPMAGSMLGGALGFASPLPGGLIAGGALGAAGGKALQNVIEQGLLGEEKTRDQIYSDPIREGVTDATFGMGIPVAGRIARGVGNVTVRPMMSKLARYGAGQKEGAEEILEASKRLGVTPTRGMLTDERTVQKLESGLAQSGSDAGDIVAKRLEKVQKGLEKSAEGVFGKTGDITKIQASEAGKGLIEETLKKRVQPAVDVYKQIENEVVHIPIVEKSAKSVARNIKNLPSAFIEGSPEKSFVNQIGSTLENVKSLDELRRLKTYVGKTFQDRNITPTMKETAGEIYGRIARMEQRAITQASIDAARNAKHGEAVAREMIGQIKDANKLYGQVSKDVQDLAQSVGMGRVQNYQDFARKIKDIGDEKFVDKFFNPNNVNALKKFQAQFPEAFEALRTAKMGQIYNQSIAKGEISLPSLIRNVKKLSPEARALVFGKDANSVLKDIETVYNSTYGKVGPSGTPEGLAEILANPLKPTTWFKQTGDIFKKYILDNPQKFKKLAEKEAMRAPRGYLTTFQGEVLPATQRPQGQGVGRAIKGLLGGYDEE